VAGPCRIFTGFPIAPTVVGYKAGKTSSQGRNGALNPSRLG
jgi:hypothetical protein